jgi:hypothetical protein
MIFYNQVIINYNIGKNNFIRSGSSNPQYTFDAPISFNIPSSGLELASCKI